jgi:hypothetical protein
VDNCHLSGLTADRALASDYAAADSEWDLYESMKDGACRTAVVGGGSGSGGTGSLGGRGGGRSS